jgi:hypothetical protein
MAPLRFTLVLKKTASLLRLSKMENNQKPRTLKDLGYGQEVPDNVVADQPLTVSGQGVGFPEEIEAARKYAQEKAYSEQPWSDWAGDVASNVKDIATGFLPTALGGKGNIGISDIASGAAETAKEGFLFPGKAASGQIQLFDETGRPTEEAVKGGLSTVGLYTIPQSIKPVTGLPEKAASRRIRSAIQTDIETGKARGIDPTTGGTRRPQPLPGATPEYLGTLSDEGVFTSGYDLSGGPATRKLLEDAASKSEEARSAALDLQQRQALRRNDSGIAVSSTIDEIAGKNLSVGDELQAVKKAIKDTNDPNYTAVMSIPENSRIMSIDLQRIMQSRPVFKNIVKEVNQAWANKQMTPPQLLDRRGNISISANDLPSLEYLDNVYRKLRDETNVLYENGDTINADALKSARDAFRNELDRLAARLPDGSSSYKMIRDEASEVFGGKDALEAGYNYLSVSNGLKASEITNAINSYSPDQLRRFREGILSKVKEESLKPVGTNAGFNKVVSYFDGSNPAISDRLFNALGDETYYRLSNQVNIQNIVNRAKPFDVAAEPVAAKGAAASGAKIALLGGVGGGAGTYLMQNAPAITKLISASHLTPETLISGAAIAGTAGIAALYKAAGMLHNKFERAVASRIVDALASQDPASIAALNSIPPKTLNKYLTRFSYALEGIGTPSGEALKASSISGKGPETQEEQGPRKPTVGDILQLDVPGGDLPTGQSSGGRVARKSGGRIKSNPISAEVKRVRALLSQKTANMLSLPDDAIATALDLAKRT